MYDSCVFGQYMGEGGVVPHMSWLSARDQQSMLGMDAQLAGMVPFRLLECRSRTRSWFRREPESPQLAGSVPVSRLSESCSRRR
jgi:hypothetical protein